MSVAQPITRPKWGWLLLLPLPLLWAACVHYRVADNIALEFRWMLACFAAFQGVLALLAWQAQRCGSAFAAWLPVIAAMPAFVGVMVFAGPTSVIAGLLLALAAAGIGSRIVGDGRGIALSLLVGLAVVAAVVGWLLPLPIHHRALYLLATVLMLAWRRRALQASLRDAAASARALAGAHPCMAILLVAAASVASLGLWLPSLNYDDNAVHLILQSQLLADGRYAMDVQRQSWAVAPWANNVLHAVAAMLAGHEARAAMGALWLLLGIDGARRLALALGAPPAVALAAAAVFAAQPFAGYFTTTMQVDGADAAILLHLVAIAVAPNDRRPGALAIGAIAGLLFALKTINLLYAVPLLASIAWTTPRGARLRWTLRMLAMLLPVAAPSYAYAFALTGNPLFPFFNAFFRSPLYPLENLRDMKWMAGVTASAPWDLAFHAQRYGQYYAGASGLAMLATLPALLLDAVRRPATRWLAIWAIACAGLLFLQMQYLRYLFPTYAVLGVLGVVALSRCVPWRGFAMAALLLVAGDALLMPTTHWVLRSNPWAGLLHQGAAGRANLVATYVPQRALLERAMKRHPGACVLMADPKSPFVGAGHGNAISMHKRYDPDLWRAHELADRDGSGNAWRLLVSHIRPSYVILDASLEPVLVGSLQQGGWILEDEEGAVQAWRHRQVPEQRRHCFRHLQAGDRKAPRPGAPGVGT